MTTRPEDPEELKKWLAERLVVVVAPATLPEEGDPIDLADTALTERLLERIGWGERLLAKTEHMRVSPKKVELIGKNYKEKI